METSFFITITSQNHCGVLPAITTALSELGGDMQHASQAIVHNLFTMTIAAHFPSHRTEEVILDHLLRAGRDYGMDVMIRPLSSTGEEEMNIGNPYFLSVSGRDAPGVLRVISGMLAQHLIAIDSLSALPDSSETFSMLMRITIPPTIDVIALRREMNEFGLLNGLTVSIYDENEYYQSEDSTMAAFHNVERD